MSIYVLPKGQNENPKECWSFFTNYIYHYAAMAFSILYLIYSIVESITHEKKAPISAPNIRELIQCTSLGVSLIGFVIFLIKPAITFFKYVSEETPDDESFSKNIVYLIRTQWFIPLLSMTFLMTNLSQSKEAIYLFVIPLFNLIVDFMLTSTWFGIINPRERKRAQYLLLLASIVLFVVQVPFVSYMTSFFLCAIKISNYYFNKKTAVFLETVYEEKLRKKIRFLNMFIVINLYLCLYVVFNNVSALSRLSMAEYRVFGLLEGFIRSLVSSNASKIVAWFL